MAHVRKQIRDAVKTLLTGLGYTPVSSLSRALQSSEVATWVVSNASESSDVVTMDTSERTQARLLDLVTTAVVRAESATDDTLDAMAAALETAWTDRTLAGVCQDRRLVSSEFDFSGEGDLEIGTAALTWQVEYSTTENTPETAL
ncbi:MAG: hypothetical protein KJO07_24000 [Deltaproteobacteria bacterium]|nr:hypothetical protein [Deltaproteobacteria bacterium]